ncbi:MAG: hypothetical protein VXA08_07305, partial [Alphaproteobacteria bacterium]
GRTTIGAKGSQFVAVESWIRSCARSPCSANDCDGSALLITSVLQRCADATPEELAKHDYVRAVRNAICPFYTFGIGIVAARSAEASGGHGSGGVAGHAVAVMMPTLTLLDAIHDASGYACHGEPAKTSSAARELRAARFESIFTPEILAELPTEQRIHFAKGPEAASASLPANVAARLQPFIVEGTTPSSPIMHVHDDAKRAEAKRVAKLDEDAFAKFSPNIARGMKSLHTANWYVDLVEFGMHAKHPLYVNERLRAMGEATSQLVFCPRPASGQELKTAGASPQQVAKSEFVFHPLAKVSEAVGTVLDYASEVAKRDVMPAREGVYRLSVAQTRDLARSLDSLKKLDDRLEKKDVVDGHCVAYVLSYSTLVSNPSAVESFCVRVAAGARAGVVDSLMVDDLAVNADGSPAGALIFVNCVV